MIMQITDTHLQYLNDGSPEEDTLRLISDAIENQKPDLVVSTGDLVWSRISDKTLKGFCEFMAERKQKWSFVFGNHDAEHSAKEKTLEKILLDDPWCIYEHGDTSVKGYGNFTINLFNNDNRLRWVLYMMDSGAGNKVRNVGGYDYMDHTQVSWYARTRNDLLSRNGVHSSLFFFHMPLPEYEEVWRTRQCVGEKNEGICAPKINSGLFTAMLEDNGSRGVFVGHDHTNDFCGDLYGIRLCYGRGTGFGTNQRGAYGKDGFLHGVRMIRADMAIQPSRPEFSTYLYLEDGTIVTEQPIHEPGKA